MTDEREETARAAELLRAAGGSTVVLTGAGVSTASGLPDYRSPTGLWATVNPAQVANPRALAEDPARFWAFYGERFDGLRRVRPNDGHEALARLEQAGLVRAVITQNVDGLHQAAGSRRVLELHGRLDALRCTGCEATFHGVDPRDLASSAGVPRCDRCGGVIRPGVVLFGEPMPASLDEAYDLAAQAGVMLAAGSSLKVTPAAALPLVTLQAAGDLIVANATETTADHAARVLLRGDLPGVLSAIADQALA